MPGSRGGKMASRGRRGRKRKITKDIVAPGSHCLNFVSNNYVYNGKLVTCDRCAKWRLLEEYQQACLPRYMHFDCSMWNISEEDKGSCDIPQVQDDSILINELYTPGSIVSAKMRGHPWWPAMIEAHDFQVFYHKKPLTELKYHVVFFGERVTRSWIAEKHLEPFCESSFRSVATKQDMKIAIRDAVRAQKMTREDRLDTFGFGKRYNVIKLPENGTKNTNKRPSCPTEDSTIGDMAERAECSRPSGIVEEEPARKRYRKNLAKEAGVVPPSKLQLKKAELKNKVKEVKKGSQGRLTRFRKKECLSENKESETEIGTEEDPKIPDERCIGSVFLKRNGTNKCRLEAVANLKFRSRQNFEDKAVQTAPQDVCLYTRRASDKQNSVQSRVCSDLLVSLHGNGVYYEVYQQPYDEELDYLADERNKDDEFRFDLTGASIDSEENGTLCRHLLAFRDILSTSAPVS